MSSKGSIYKAGLCGLAVLLLCCAGYMQDQLNTARKELGFTKVEPLQNAPPVLAFTTVALGGFRGLIANALWMRATDLQEADKYFEMVQLADWITKLQPRMVSVWLMQAWNMAYNVSVKFKNPEDRWLWVQRGIQLLRDDGLRYNPNDSLMYREISWIYQHKIGQNLDDAHMTYKLHLAQQMQDIFPGGHVNAEELEHPTTAQWQERAKKLRDTYKMDPQIVASVEQQYGPLDWRLPDAHAIYWAEMGRLYAGPKDQDTLRRSIFQTMRLACLRGGGLPPTVTNVTANNFFLRPNLELIPTISATYEKMKAEEKDPGQQMSFTIAHKNFLKEAVPMLYVDNQRQKAAYWWKYLNANFTNVFSGKDVGISMDDYVFKTLTEDAGETDMSKVTGILLGLIDTEFQCLVLDEDDKAASLEGLARKVLQHYRQGIAGASEKRLPLKDLSFYRQYVLEGDLAGRMSPENAAILRTKLRLPPAGATPAPVEGGDTNSPPP